jgi:hypothetical protein
MKYQKSTKPPETENVERAHEQIGLHSLAPQFRR